MSEEARRDAGLMDDYTAAVKKYFLPIVDLSHIRPLDFLDEFGFDLKTFEFGYDLMKGLKEIMSPDQLKRVALLCPPRRRREQGTNWHEGVAEGRISVAVRI